MSDDKGQVFGFTEIEWQRKEVNRAKKRYLKYLIELGYVLLQKGSYSDTQYWAIHPSYYLTENEQWEQDCFIDGTISPEFYPEGAFILINSIVESETNCWYETDYLLYENKCSLDYLSEV